jgi:hypothetical protein
MIIPYRAAAIILLDGLYSIRLIRKEDAICLKAVICEKD